MHTQTPLLLAISGMFSGLGHSDCALGQIKVSIPKTQEQKRRHPKFLELWGQAPGRDSRQQREKLWFGSGVSFCRGAESLRVATPAVHAQPGSQLPHSCRSDQPACSPSAMTFSHLRPHLEVARPLQAAPPAPKLFPPIPLTFEGTRGYFAPSSTTDPGDRCSSTQVWDLPSVQRWEKVGKVASQRHHLSRPALRLTFLCAREVADL